MSWPKAERYGVLIHECCHCLFPAVYPRNHQHLANVIDDVRIERQFLATKPWYAPALALLASHRIAQAADGDDRITDEFSPEIWVLLRFRSHVPEEIRQAADDALIQQAVALKRWANPSWQARLKTFIARTWEITRLGKVSTATLDGWAEEFLVIFPWKVRKIGTSAEITGTPGAGQEDEIGAVDGTESGIPTPGDAASDGLAKAVARWRETAAEEVEVEPAVDTPVGYPGQQCQPTYTRDERGFHQHDYPKLALRSSRPHAGLLDGLRRALARLAAEGVGDLHPARRGRLDLQAVRRAGRLGLIPRHAFIRHGDERVDPYSVDLAVAVDCSGSTQSVRGQLDSLAHALVLAARSQGFHAGCGYWSDLPLIAARSEDRVRSDQWPTPDAHGGTNLDAAARLCSALVMGCCRRQRAALIVSDGEVQPSQLASTAAALLQAGFTSSTLLCIGQCPPNCPGLKVISVKAIGQVPTALERWLVGQLKPSRQGILAHG